MALPAYEDDPPIEHSGLERRFMKDGVTVEVLIYRAPTIDMRWTLEVREREGGLVCLGSDVRHRAGSL